MHHVRPRRVLRSPWEHIGGGGCGPRAVGSAAGPPCQAGRSHPWHQLPPGQPGAGRAHAITEAAESRSLPAALLHPQPSPGEQGCPRRRCALEQQKAHNVSGGVHVWVHVREREGRPGNPPRETQTDTTVRMHLQCNVFPCSLTLQHFHSTMSSQAVVTGHSTAVPEAELVLLLQPALLLP